jgi:hypothetical protein
MDPNHDSELHYAMLEYLFRRRKLAESCFRYAWDDFIRDNDQFGALTTKDLKTIFWTEIANNIGRYQQLTEAQKEYFDPDYFCVQTAGENTLQVLENNEPKAGFDYTFSTTTATYQGLHNETLLPNATTAEEQLEIAKDLFKKPTICTSIFGEAAGIPEENEIEENSRINIIAQKPLTDVADMGEHPLEIFKDILLTDEDRANGKITLSEEEVFERLADPDLVIDFADGLKQLMYHKFNANLCLDDEVASLKITKQAAAPGEDQQMKPPSQPVKKAAPPRSPFGARATTSTPLIRSPIKTRQSFENISAIAKRRSLLASIQQSRSPKSKQRGDLIISKSESAIGEKSSEKK